MIKKFFKQLFCPHLGRSLNSWHVRKNRKEIEAEYICDCCGKTLLMRFNIYHKEMFEAICSSGTKLIR